MAHQVCSVPRCSNPVYRDGLCKVDYEEWRDNGGTACFGDSRLTEHLNSEVVSDAMVSAGMSYLRSVGSLSMIDLIALYRVMARAARPVNGVTPSSGCVSFDLGIPCFEVERVRAAMARTETEGFTPEIEQILMDDLPAILAALTDTTTKEKNND